MCLHPHEGRVASIFLPKQPLMVSFPKRHRMYLNGGLQVYSKMIGVNLGYCCRVVRNDLEALVDHAMVAVKIADETRLVFRFASPFSSGDNGKSSFPDPIARLAAKRDVSGLDDRPFLTR
jgi:hypothetical protein